MGLRLPTLISLCLATIACGAAAPNAAAQQPAAPPAAPVDDPLIAGDLADDAAIAKAIREHYTKYDYRIAMRDGVKLYTSAYVPKDASRTYPILFQRTPYSVAPYGVDAYPDGKNARVLRRFAPSTELIEDGYIFVHQDVRGRMMSEGTFVDVRPINPGGVDESTDAYDSIDWLVKNVPRNSGKVGVWGISYPGFYAAQAAVNAHPALKAVSPQAPVTDWFEGDDFHHNGAFMLADAFSFYASFGKPRPAPTKKLVWGFEYDAGDAYEFFLGLGPLANADKRHLKGEIAFWNDLMAHPNLDDFWKARNPRPHYKNVKPAMMTVGGWFDAEDLFGTLETYRAFEKQSPGAKNSLVMGPWRHGGWARNEGDSHGDITFGQKTSRFYREKIEFPFFQQHLKGRKKDALPEAWVFEMGTNEWHSYAAWPPAGGSTAVYHLQPGGKLALAAPGESAFDEWVSDPNKPVPYRGEMAMEIEAFYMSGDQRFASRRPDVVTYQSDVLEADVTMLGPLEASLWVSVTGTDADFVVKLVDVYPADYPDPDPNPTGVHMGGYQQLVRGEVMRGKFRNGFEAPEAFKPGEPTLVRFALPDVAHAFRAGHRIMVQVQSSWFPLVDRNPQTFTDIYKATDADFRVATHRIHHGPGTPSGLKVTLAPK
jgi:putative CocE/NonD family hydrolase